MTNMSKILIGSAGLTAALAIASPAIAQQPYPYGNQNGVVGAIINSVTGGGYGQYPQGNYGYSRVDERGAVSMCAAAAEQRISSNYRGQPGYGYTNGNGYNGYQQGYANGTNGHGARVLGITNVERRNNGVRVSGTIDSGRYASRASYGAPAYGAQAYGAQAYGVQAYGAPGYPNQGYGNRAYNGVHADLTFRCNVDYRGAVTNLRVRNNGSFRRPY